MGDVEAAVGQRPVIPRADQQVLAALAAIRARKADIRHPAEPHVVDRPENRARRRHRRDVEHHRTVREIDEGPEVDRVRVRRQKERRRVHQLGEDENLVVLDADAEKAPANRVERRSREAVQVRLDAPDVIQVVVEELGRLRCRGTVSELERPELGLHRVGRRDRCQGFVGCRTHLCQLLPFANCCANVPRRHRQPRNW